MPTAIADNEPVTTYQYINPDMKVILDVTRRGDTAWFTHKDMVTGEQDMNLTSVQNGNTTTLTGLEWNHIGNYTFNVIFVKNGMVTKVDGTVVSDRTGKVMPVSYFWTELPGTSMTRVDYQDQTTPGHEKYFGIPDNKMETFISYFINPEQVSLALNT